MDRDDDLDAIDEDDLPSTHLDDDEYEAFLKDEFDGGGRLKGDPPVVWILVGVIAVLLVLMSLLA